MTAKSITSLSTAGTTDATILAAATTTFDPVLIDADSVEGFGVQFRFVVGGGGTNVKAYLQGSLDGGSTYFDIACVVFATSNEISMCGFRFGACPLTAPTDGSMTDDSLLNSGVIPAIDRVRLKTISTGTYTTGTTLSGRLVAA